MSLWVDFKMGGKARRARSGLMKCCKRNISFLGGLRKGARSQVERSLISRSFIVRYVSIILARRYLGAMREHKATHQQGKIIFIGRTHGKSGGIFSRMSTVGTWARGGFLSVLTRVFMILSSLWVCARKMAQDQLQEMWEIRIDDWWSRVEKACHKGHEDE